MKSESKGFQPLRIRAYLQTGVISDKFLPLDAILYYHAVRQAFGEQDVSLPGESTVKHYGKVKLPFLMRNTNVEHQWYYACSFAQWPENTVEDKAFYVKQHRIAYSDLVDFKRKRGRIDNKRGRYKSYHVNVYYRHALHVDWYCVGDKEELLALLKFCTNIGKKAAQGWGAVKAWEVTEWPEDWSKKNSQGKLMRAIPANSGKGFVYGIRPSYWNRKHQFPCYMPE